jgi:hypothetical protein
MQQLYLMIGLAVVDQSFYLDFVDDDHHVYCMNIDHAVENL